jgi:hypothetical protein
MALWLLKTLHCSIDCKRTFWIADGSIDFRSIHMQPSGIVCVLRWSNFLRKTGTHYVFVGCCYVYVLTDCEMATMTE